MSQNPVRCLPLRIRETRAPASARFAHDSWYRHKGHLIFAKQLALLAFLCSRSFSRDPSRLTNSGRLGKVGVEKRLKQKLVFVKQKSGSRKVVDWDMHNKYKDISRCVGVKKVGQIVAGLGKLAWRKDQSKSLSS